MFVAIFFSRIRHGQTYRFQEERPRGLSTMRSLQTSRTQLHAAYFRIAKEKKNTLKLLAKPPPIHYGKIGPEEACSFPQLSFSADVADDHVR
jgi:hypothetical protein